MKDIKKHHFDWIKLIDTVKNHTSAQAAEQNVTLWISNVLPKKELAMILLLHESNMYKPKQLEKKKMPFYHENFTFPHKAKMAKPELYLVYKKRWYANSSN